jgi:hypothetical protein
VDSPLFMSQETGEKRLELLDIKMKRIQTNERWEILMWREMTFKILCFCDNKFQWNFCRSFSDHFSDWWKPLMATILTW